MALPSPEPVKYFVAVLCAESSVWPDLRTRLESHWGAIDFEGPDRPFDLTNYYEAEMGAGLRRRLIAFEPLLAPDQLAPAKQTCIALEAEFALPQGRRVNLDVGYLDHNKIVLASVKAAGQKIYLCDGIYADLVARYADGRYQPFPWTFPDFKHGRYDAELGSLRGRYLHQLKAWRSRRKEEI